MSTKQVYLVIGGSGFLGKHLVEMLLKKGEAVAIFDLVQRFTIENVPFFPGDIVDKASIENAIQKSGATVVFHTVSPIHGLPNPDIYTKVNVHGTQAVIDACIATSLKYLVYTSSAGVVFDGGDLIDVDERLPYPAKPYDIYNDTKAQAETLVLQANGKSGLKTCALRPAGIFGPGERQAIQHMVKPIAEKKTHFQIGPNTNLFDWTYVENVAHAHILAAQGLITQSAPLPTTIAKTVLEPINNTTGTYRIPTSEARPLGPAVDPPANAKEISSAFHSSFNPIDPTFVVHSKWDQYSPTGLQLAIDSAPEHTHPLQVAGQAFFITNGEPTYCWDFIRTLWFLISPSSFPSPSSPGYKKTVVLNYWVAICIAWITEWVYWVLRKEPALTMERVGYLCATRWYNIEKARRVLGYAPIVGMDEGIRKTAEWWLAEQQKAS
ncbi:C-3 sterol dehydrogenase [Sistotremastrum suecicum HHB10207 ss-3]|uniref:C-3 sterol dehydrogenase n=1 Tax=Sistotremastrum suecicum HHB10207 ss-3 TaxID=1314776 RepID=A0A166C529_9AGAM|nr:C-3 sterol dehydrogenase [Sistotremastrum suecicum HHB10207 ss-3]